MIGKCEPAGWDVESGPEVQEQFTTVRQSQVDWFRMEVVTLNIPELLVDTLKLCGCLKKG